MKRLLIHLIALLLLIVAFTLQRMGAPPMSGAADPIADYRTARSETRSRAAAGYAALANDPDAGVRDAAARALLELSQRIAVEGDLEYALHMRGFRTATAAVTARSATVFLHSAALTDAERAVLLETVLDHTDLPASAVRIVPVR